MELHQKYTIVLTNDGKFQKTIPIEGVEVGAEVEYDSFMQKNALLFFHPRRRISRPLHLLMLLCVLLIFAIPFYFLIGDEETYAYVNVDINPSIELEVDESLLVNNVLPLNEDAREIVDELSDCQHEHLEKVIAMIMHESEDTGLTSNGKHMLVGVSYVAKDQKENKSILDHLKQYIIKENPSWDIATFKVPEEIRQKAEANNKPMNEEMANTIVETDESDLLDKDDEAIINSFYNTEKVNKSE